ncbi:MAG: hypothetical protein GTO40_10945, partial [Deltaproteobacteria bacterium]|nr:hypothetical protein [Deltaproteobacteria bacterium]
MLFRSLLNEEPEQDNGNPPLPADGEEGGLWRWILLSGVLHLGVIAIVLLVPHTPFSRTINYPVYTVELVGSEKIGGGTPITAIETSPLPPSKPKPVKSKPAVTVKTEVPPKPLAPKKTVKETAKKAKTPAVALVKKPAKRKKLKNKVQRAPRKKAPKKTLRAEVSKSPSRTSQSTAGEAREKM